MAKTRNVEFLRSEFTLKVDGVHYSVLFTKSRHEDKYFIDVTENYKYPTGFSGNPAHISMKTALSYVEKLLKMKEGLQ